MLGIGCVLRVASYGVPAGAQVLRAGGLPCNPDISSGTHRLTSSRWFYDVLIGYLHDIGRFSLTVNCDKGVFVDIDDNNSLSTAIILSYNVNGGWGTSLNSKIT